MMWLCRVGVHRWEYEFRGLYWLPTRTCTRCGKVQVQP